VKVENNIEEMSKEERLEKLKSINPEAHRVLSAIIEARGEKQDGVPDGFAYVRALQEYDKEEGITVKKGHYGKLLNDYDKTVEPYRK
jgi:hypothetical protein